MFKSQFQYQIKWSNSACALPGGLANGGRGIGSVGQRVCVFQDEREEFFFVYI